MSPRYTSLLYEYEYAQYANEHRPACIAVLLLGDVVAEISVERFGAGQSRLE